MEGGRNSWSAIRGMYDEEGSRVVPQTSPRPPSWSQSPCFSPGHSEILMQESWQSTRCTQGRDHSRTPNNHIIVLSHRRPSCNVQFTFSSEVKSVSAVSMLVTSATAEFYGCISASMAPKVKQVEIPVCPVRLSGFLSLGLLDLEMIGLGSAWHIDPVLHNQIRIGESESYMTEPKGSGKGTHLGRK